MLPRPPRSPLFPYTTLFRSLGTLMPRFREGQLGTRRQNSQRPHPLQERRRRHPVAAPAHLVRSEEHTSELQSPYDLVCRLLLEKKKNKQHTIINQPYPHRTK